MIGQREKITYRVITRAGHSGSFLPPHGVGYGLGEDFGLALNRTVKGPTKFRMTHRTVTGIVVTEDADHVTIERNDGRQFRIPVSNIVKLIERP